MTANYKCTRINQEVLQAHAWVLVYVLLLQLTILGQFTANLTFKHITCKQTVFMVKDLKSNLLRLPAITSLNLISRINSIYVSADEIKKLYFHLFQGLGSMREEHEIKLKEDAKPFSLHTARNVPLPLRSKVQKELRRMESLGVISPVSQPSSWCSGMVVVPKPSGQVRIYVDLKHLNECIQSISSITACWRNTSPADRSSSVDANNGFWQIPLARKSRLLTTFITPFGRY